MRKKVTVQDVVTETGDLMIFISGSLLAGTYGELTDKETEYAKKMSEIIPIYEELCEIYSAKVPCKILQFRIPTKGHKDDEQIG